MHAASPLESSVPVTGGDSRNPSHGTVREAKEDIIDAKFSFSEMAGRTVLIKIFRHGKEEAIPDD